MLGDEQERTLTECFEVFKVIHDVVNTLSAVRRVTREALEDMHADNVVYAELRTTPRAVEGEYTCEEYVDAVVDEISTFAGSDAGMQVYLLLSLNRGRPVQQASDTVDLLLRRRWPLVKGVELSGNPLVGDARDFIPALKAARETGYCVSAHLAEVDTPVAVRETDELLGTMCTLADGSTVPLVQRLGHAALLNETQSEQVLRQRIPVEVCPTSSEKTLQLNSLREHWHLEQWLQSGHPICVCTDDSGVFDTTLSQEYDKVHRAFSDLLPDYGSLYDLSLRAVDMCFCGDNDKQRLRQVLGALH
ncbi:MAG: hypothetical protein MHM6MM_008736 [Cercozoa sp. M6MM]